MRRYAKPLDRPERIYREEAKEIAIDLEPYKWYPQRTGRVDLIIERAKATGRNTDPVVRQEIAKVMIMARSAEWTARRARASQAQGRPQGPEGSLGKLAASYIARAANQVHTLISGADAMLTGKDSPMDGVIAEILVSTPAISIAGGTDEIQKNISNPDIKALMRFMARDESRHAGFINSSLKDFGLGLYLGGLKRTKAYTYFKPKYIFYATYLSEKIMHEKFGRRLQKSELFSFKFDREFMVENYLHAKGLKFVCLLYTSDAADDLRCVDLGGRRIIKKKKSSH